MHSKLQGLAKPNRLSMPRPAGECPRAVSGEPQAGCIARRRGETYGARTLGVYPESQKKGRPRVAAGGMSHHLCEAASEETGKNGKKPAKRGVAYLRTRKPARTGGDPRGSPYAEHRTRQRWLGHVVDGDDRERRRRAEEGRGPAPEVSCSPPAEYPRPPLAFQREKLTAWNCAEVVVRSKPLRKKFAQARCNGL